MISTTLLKQYPKTEAAFSYIKNKFLPYARTYGYILEHFDEDFLKNSEALITDIQKMDGKESTAGLDSFIKLSLEYLVLQNQLIKTGSYASSSFSDVLDKVYLNKDIMPSYMHGLLYTQIFWPNHYKFGTYFLDFIKKLGKASRVMDVPIGDGIFVYHMQEHLKFDRLDAFDISGIAVDFSKRFLTSSQRLSSKMNISTSNVFDLPNTPVYDLIVCGELLEHLEKPEELLVKLKAMLKDDGVLFLTTAIFAANVDHIYLFNTAEEVTDMLSKYFKIHSELILPASFKDHTKGMRDEAINYACILSK